MNQILNLARAAKAASRVLANLSSSSKNDFLVNLALTLRNKQQEILTANAEDVRESVANGASKAFVDRLTLSEARILSLSYAVESVATLPDPVGIILDSRTLPNNLSIKKMSVPFGTILMVYESRPNVTIDAATLCIKSGNAAILKGGKEAIRTNQLFCS